MSSGPKKYRQKEIKLSSLNEQEQDYLSYTKGLDGGQCLAILYQLNKSVYKELQGEQKAHHFTEIIIDR